ncbi:hypothetical protein PsorP6_009115 [Peronosclerospora sorghi]|uniref:Uncharacterized protein n=1 Tax=Peronosclerospora sorghi TaxID=230839 RepID=A0ACC0VZD7_9STRA|nr:hypothetical protein PsorP6_009115 [Peronosclerospora sorghi]
MFVSSAFENVTGSFQLGFRESSVNTSSCNSRLDVTLAGRGVAQRFCFPEEVFFGGLRTAQKTTAERAFQWIARAQQQVLYSLQNGLYENGPEHNVGAKQDVYRMHECALEMFDALMITPEKRQDLYFAKSALIPTFLSGALARSRCHPSKPCEHCNVG